MNHPEPLSPSPQVTGPINGTGAFFLVLPAPRPSLEAIGGDTTMIKHDIGGLPLAHKLKSSFATGNMQTSGGETESRLKFF